MSNQRKSVSFYGLLYRALEEDYKSKIKWQNKLLRKDGYTGPELGMEICRGFTNE